MPGKPRETALTLQSFGYLGINREAHGVGEIMRTGVQPTLWDVSICDEMAGDRKVAFRTPLLSAARTHTNDWGTFASSWDALGQDKFMGDGGTYRKRKYSTLRWASNDCQVRLMPEGPMFQASSYNALNGGKLRYFEPVERYMLDSESFVGIFDTCLAAFNRLEQKNGRDGIDWFIEVDQFRILARPGEPGSPTPEGIHSDGVDYFAVVMVGRNGVLGGETTIYGHDRIERQSTTLLSASDTVFVDDNAVLHGVSPVTLAPGHDFGTRDVMVLSYTNRLRPGSMSRRFGLE